MNVYGAVVLVTLVVDYGLSLAADVLNLRALRREPPPGFDDVYPAEEYRRSQDYTRVRTRFGLAESTFDLAVLLGVWFAGGFAWLDLQLRALGAGTVVTGLLYIGVLVLVKGVLDLPFRIYSTFVIEERFGFNRTTARVFVTDLVKSLGLGLVLGAPILAAVLWFFERVGEHAWLYCWGVSTLFILVLQLVFPTWILPLFNKFEPLAEGELRETLAGYAKAAGFALSGIFVMDGSRRTSRANAFFTGFGKSRRIALFDTLIAQQSVGELVAVVAHEVGHYKKKHILKGLIIGVVHTGVTFYLLSIFLGHRGLYEAFYVDTAAVYTGLVFFGLLFSPIELVLSFFLNRLLRRHEFEADRFAVDTVAEPAAMITALKKLAADNLTNLTPHPFYVALHYSHPPMVERIGAIRRHVAARTQR
ncbi:MAG: M48 family metallopeptidase [bacterium]|nr:M48 family metallopeptidase [bacterium]